MNIFILKFAHKEIFVMILALLCLSLGSVAPYNQTLTHDYSNIKPST